MQETCPSRTVVGGGFGYTEYAPCQKAGGHVSPEHLFVNAVTGERVTWTDEEAR